MTTKRKMLVAAVLAIFTISSASAFGGWGPKVKRPRVKVPSVSVPKKSDGPRRKRVRPPFKLNGIRR